MRIARCRISDIAMRDRLRIWVGTEELGLKHAQHSDCLRTRGRGGGGCQSVISSHDSPGSVSNARGPSLRIIIIVVHEADELHATGNTEQRFERTPLSHGSARGAAPAAAALDMPTVIREGVQPFRVLRDRDLKRLRLGLAFEAAVSTHDWLLLLHTQLRYLCAARRGGGGGGSNRGVREAPFSNRFGESRRTPLSHGKKIDDITSSPNPHFFCSE